jgi:hypothetical protein
MPFPLNVSSYQQDRLVQSSIELLEVLSSADSRGGGDFWLAFPGQEFPCLAIRTSTGEADIHYFPTAEHPGFRRLADMPNQSDRLFQFQGCDPYEGEVVPGEFGVSLAQALAIANCFAEQVSLHESSQWFEL